MSEDQGSVGPLAAPSVPSPSLANEPATPSEEVLRAKLVKAQKAVARAQADLSAAVKARREAAPNCGRGNHDIEVIVGCGPCAYTGYVCRKCSEEEWL